MDRDQQILSKVLHRIINEYSTNQQRTSTFWWLKFVNFNDLYRLHPNLRSVINVSSKSPQRIITEGALKHQSFGDYHNIKISLMFASKSSESHQRLFNESSTTINQSSRYETSKFEKKRIKSSIDQKRLRPKIRSVINVSSKSPQRIITEGALKHQSFGDYHNKKNIINVCVEVIKVSSTSLQRIFNND